MVQVHVFNREGTLVGPVDSPKVELTDRQWQQRLTGEQYEVLRAKGTERPFCGTLLDNKQQGVYTCVGCGLPLFSSDSKFHSGTGWPSFFQPIAPENVTEHRDVSHGMVRSEILCARCDGHLGHVFDDGPRPTGLRFCLNSESLSFTASENVKSLADPAADHSAPAEPEAGEIALFAGGCFWCTEAAFEQLAGVLDVESGYCGGARHGRLRVGVLRQDRPRRGDSDHVRSENDHVRPAARRVLRRARPDAAQSPGKRRWHPIPLGDFSPE